MQVTLADLELAMGTGALPVHPALCPQLECCPQRPQHSAGVSLRSCRTSGPLSWAGIRISFRGGGDSGTSALLGPTPSPGGLALRRAFYLVPSPQRVCGFVNCWLQEFPCGGSHP